MTKGCIYINYWYYQHVWVTCMYTLNHIGGVMVGVLTSFVVDHGLGPRSSHTIINIMLLDTGFFWNKIKKIDNGVIAFICFFFYFHRKKI